MRDRVAVFEDAKEGVERRIEELRARRCAISRADSMELFSAAADGDLSDGDLIDLFVAKAWLYDGKVGLVLNVDGISVPFWDDSGISRAREARMKTAQGQTSL